MDTPSGFQQNANQKKRANNRPNKSQGQKTQLFQDTSSQPPPQSGGYMYQPQPGQDMYTDPNLAYTGQQPGSFPGQQYINDPMANMAVQYGQNLAGQGKDMMNKHLEQYVSASKIKYYFAVDTAYVGKKLGLLAFPFRHSDWSMHYNQDEPIAPRYELNAPDMYIPVMAFVTYVLVAGIVLGTQDRFTPEQLGIQASSALVWLIIEVLCILFSLYVMNLSTDLKYLDVIAYSGYKYVGMIACLVTGLVFKAMGYYAMLLWFSVTTACFLIWSLKVQIVPRSDADGFTRTSKHSIYLILAVAGIQPVFMWWLTRHIVFS